MLLDKWALIQVGVHRDCCQSQGPASEQSMPHCCALQSLPALGTVGPTGSVMSTEPAAWQLLTFLQRLSSQYFSKKRDMLSLEA